MIHEISRFVVEYSIQIAILGALGSILAVLIYIAYWLST